MALPILETQSFDLTLPSADVKIKFRPFLVKEEKVLLQALESEDQKQVVRMPCSIKHIRGDKEPRKPKLRLL